MDYSRSVGGAALGARLRRLSEGMDGEATRIYATLGLDFEQRWFGVLNQLALKGPATVGELAAALHITHVSVSQTRQSLEAAGIVASASDPADGRRRQLALTDAGRALIERLAPLWAALDAAAVELNAEAGDVVSVLDRLDDALADRPLFDRVMARLDRPAT